MKRKLFVGEIAVDDVQHETQKYKNGVEYYKTQQYDCND